MIFPQVNESDKVKDKRLVSALKRREPNAFEQLVLEHQNRVFSLCLRMMKNPEEAEDLAQEVFITVFKSIDRFRGDSMLSTWIYRITRNHCLNRIKFLDRRAYKKKQSLTESHSKALAGMNHHQPVAARIPQPDQLAEGKQMEAIVSEQLGNLSEEHRELILLRDLENLSYEEIQDITGLAPGTVKSRLHRARMELARSLAPYLEEK